MSNRAQLLESTLPGAFDVEETDQSMDDDSAVDQVFEHLASEALFQHIAC